jgi:hypothetical protein
VLPSLEPQPFLLLIYFSGRVLNFCLGSPPIFASHGAGLTEIQHHTWLSGFIRIDYTLIFLSFLLKSPLDFSLNAFIIL